MNSLSYFSLPTFSIHNSFTLPSFKHDFMNYLIWFISRIGSFVSIVCFTSIVRWWKICLRIVGYNTRVGLWCVGRRETWVTRKAVKSQTLCLGQQVPTTRQRSIRPWYCSKSKQCTYTYYSIVKTSAWWTDSYFLNNQFATLGNFVANIILYQQGWFQTLGSSPGDMPLQP